LTIVIDAPVAADITPWCYALIHVRAILRHADIPEHIHCSETGSVVGCRAGSGFAVASGGSPRSWRELVSAAERASYRGLALVGRAPSLCVRRLVNRE